MFNLKIDWNKLLAFQINLGTHVRAYINITPTPTPLWHSQKVHTGTFECSVAKYAYLCGGRIRAGTMRLIHYLTPRCSLLLAPLSVCPNGKNTSHTFGDRGR